MSHGNDAEAQGAKISSVVSAFRRTAIVPRNGMASRRHGVEKALSRGVRLGSSMKLGESTFETERLRLEPLRVSHATELFELLSDDRMYIFVPQEPPATLAALTRRFALLETRRSPDGSEDWLNWAVRSQADGVCVGCIQVTIRRDGRAQLAYELGLPYWGRGFSTEACGCVIEALFADGISEVWAELDTRNLASMRLLERLGFRRGTLRRNADFFKGSESHEWTYSLVRVAAKEER